MSETQTRNYRKTRTGVVVSISGEKSVSVEITSQKRHPKYGKMITSTKKFLCHDENSISGLGDTVRIMECRPMSKHKHWRVVEIIERAK